MYLNIILRRVATARVQHSQLLYFVYLEYSQQNNLLYTGLCTPLNDILYGISWHAPEGVQ
jgi:hypothetical protein